MDLHGPPNTGPNSLFLVQGSSDLAGFTLRKGKIHILTDSLSLPVYVAVLSALLLVVHIVVSRRGVRSLWRRLRSRNATTSFVYRSYPSQAPRETTFSSEMHERIMKHGGALIYGVKLVRVLGCTVFLILCLVSAIIDEENRLGANTLGKKQKKKKRRREDPVVSQKELQDLALCLTSLYAVFLSFVTVGNRRRWAKTTARHLNVIFLTFIGVYAYRDLFPLATFNRSPIDIEEGWLLWAKLCTVFILAIVIPLTMPRQYIPCNAKEPMQSPNAEQTSSILSLVTFTFLNPVVSLASRAPHLLSDVLPALADRDYAKNIRARSFPHLDAFRKRRKSHLFFGLIRVFRKKYVMLSLVLVVQVLAGFASPLGLKNLLQYIETGGEKATIKPWLWILCLFLGPIIGSIAKQWYTFATTKATIRVECILTQLVFEHSSRARMKAEDMNLSKANLTSQAARFSHITNVPVAAGESEPLRPEASRESSAETAVAQEGPGPKSWITKLDSSEKLDGSSPRLVEKIRHLVTTDLGNIVEAWGSLPFLLVSLPLQVSLCIAFLYHLLGWSSFIGVAVMIVLLPLPRYVAKLIQGVQVKCDQETDSRVQMVSEIMRALRMIKMSGWGRKMGERISEKREEELCCIWRRQILGSVNGFLSFLIPIATMVATYTTFVVVMHRRLSPSIVFSSMMVFDMLRDQVNTMFLTVNRAIAGKVSLDRVDDFLKNTELLDRFTTKRAQLESQEEVGIGEALFAWSNDDDGASTPSKRRFVLRIEHELIFASNEVNLIVGPPGSGKTSLLMALLGEMHYIPTSQDSWYNLPRSEGVAYAAQEPWILNATIRANILFGSPYDEERYNNALYQCALTRDLSYLEAGDQTEVGEQGLTLSDSQRSRISLARAIYSPARSLLLDDVLAALDFRTAKWVVDKCFAGDLVKGRTVLLVTQRVSLARPVASFIVSMGCDGRISSQGPISEVVKLDQDLARMLEEGEHLTKGDDDNLEDDHDQNKSSSGGKPNVASEETNLEHVGWGPVNMYLLAFAGKRPLPFCLAFFGGLGLYHVALALQTWFLGFWASQYTDRPTSEVSIPYYFSIYGSLVLGAMVIYAASYATYTFGSIRASRTLHRGLIQAILGTTLRWIDTTPVSRVIAHCTQDVRNIDGPIASGLFELSNVTLLVLVKFSAVITLTPMFFTSGLIVAFGVGVCSQGYMRARLPVKREMCNARTSVLSHFGAAISGLTSLRAYGTQEAFFDESMQRINRYTRAARTFHGFDRWVCLNIDVMDSALVSSLAVYLVYIRKQGAANAGFSLNMAAGFSGMILWWIRTLNDIGVRGQSLNQVDRYMKIEQEPKSTREMTPPAHWPSSGSLKIKRLSARYPSDGPKVLHDISFKVKAGERIGILGCSGSENSALTLALLRCIPTEGRVLYDGVDNSTIDLEVLRSKISVIPQIPELLGGSLRKNLDPFGQYDDATLNDALRSAGLFSLQLDDESRPSLSLDSQILNGGLELSVGQRRIITLAGVIIRGSKLVIIEEATPVIDHDSTDEIFQNSLRHQLAADVTVLTISHRSRTIMNADKIMIIDAGKIVEFDTPSQLMRNPSGPFRQLVEESGNRTLVDL